MTAEHASKTKSPRNEVGGDLSSRFSSCLFGNSSQPALPQILGQILLQKCLKSAS